MEHKYFKEVIQLSFLGEADEQQKTDLKNHISVCTECRAELESLKELDEYLFASKSMKVPEKLLSESRNILRDKIRIERIRQNNPGRVLDNISFFITSNYKYLVNGAAAMAAGLLIGFFLFKTPAADNYQDNNVEMAALTEEDARIRNIRIIDPNPDDDQIEFSFEAVKEVRINGSLNDKKIRNILMYAAMNGSNPGVRLNSLNVLNNSDNYDKDVKEAIISAAKYDDNPGVRREALKFLKTFPFDQEVKQSYLYIILNDTSTAMRIDAINELVQASSKGSELNNEEVEIFREKLLTDENDYIRYRARTVLEEYR
jgi:hypothetical protein